MNDKKQEGAQDRIRRVPRDLVVVVTMVVLTNVFVFVPLLADTIVRWFLGPAVLLFLPGYAFVAALFPEKPSSDWSDDASATVPEILGLSVGGSIGIVSLTGYLLNFTSFGIDYASVLSVVTLITVVTASIATVRRWRLPEGEEFRLKGKSRDVRSRIGNVSRKMMVVVIASLLLATASMGYAVVGSNHGQSFTEFYLLTENQDGELATTGYPTDLTKNQTETLYVGITNNENQNVDYTVVVEVQRVETQGGSATVLEEQEIDTFQTTVRRGDSRTLQRNVSVSMVGDDLRLTYLLYKDEPPTDPSIANSYQATYLRINVTQP